MVVDIGAGDGRWVYEMARRDASAYYVGIDPDAEALAEYAYRASRRPSRGGVANVAYVVAALEALPEEVLGIADRVRVNYPWGSLLRGLLRPERGFLDALASVARPGARFEVVLTYDPLHDHGAVPGSEPLPAPSQPHVVQVLAPAYAESGLEITESRLLSTEEALDVPSTWGRRLLHGRPRAVYFLAGVRQAL